MTSRFLLVVLSEGWILLGATRDNFPMEGEATLQFCPFILFLVLQMLPDFMLPAFSAASTLDSVHLYSTHWLASSILIENGFPSSAAQRVPGRFQVIHSPSDSDTAAEQPTL